MINLIRYTQYFVYTFHTYNFNIFLLKFQIFLHQHFVHLIDVRMTEIFVYLHPFAIVNFSLALYNICGQRFQRKNDVKIGTTKLSVMSVSYWEQRVKFSFYVCFFFYFAYYGIYQVFFCKRILKCSKRYFKIKVRKSRVLFNFRCP